MKNTLLPALPGEAAFWMLVALLTGMLIAWIVSSTLQGRRRDELRSRLEGSRARALRKARAIDAVNKQYENQILELQNDNDALRKDRAGPGTEDWETLGDDGGGEEPATQRAAQAGAEKARLLRSWSALVWQVEDRIDHERKDFERQRLAVAALTDALEHAKRAQRRSDELAALRADSSASGSGTPRASSSVHSDAASSTASAVSARIVPLAAPQALSTEEPRVIEKIVEVPVDRVVEKIVEVPVDRVVEKIVEVPVDRVVEKIVEVPVDRVVEKIVERIVRVPVESIVEKIVEKPVDRVVEKIVEVQVERIVEKRIEVPVDRIVEKIVEVPVDRVVEKIVEVPVEKIVWRDREVRVEVPFELPNRLTRRPGSAVDAGGKPTAPPSLTR